MSPKMMGPAKPLRLACSECGPGEEKTSPGHLVANHQAGPCVSLLIDRGRDAPSV